MAREEGEKGRDEIDFFSSKKIKILGANYIMTHDIFDQLSQPLIVADQ